MKNLILINFSENIFPVFSVILRQKKFKKIILKP